MQKRILLVDDDPDEAELFCEAIAEIGETECDYSHNANNALEFLNTASRRPDYIFLDVNLPGINGKRLLAELKNNPEYCNIPVIVYSTLQQPQQIKEFYKLGATFYLVKPTGFEALKKGISEVVRGMHD